MNKHEAAQLVTGGTSNWVKEEGEGGASVNIALCKYWGKRNEELNLPVTSSLSIGLPGLGAQTKVRPAARDAFFVNGTPMDSAAKAAARVFDFIRLFTREPVEVKTESTVPLAAGLASSASGFAALTKALNDGFGWNLSGRGLSILARLGSGSASRSVFDGFVRWQAGEREDGMDSFAEPLEAVWPDLRMGLLLLSDKAKPIGSREAMKRTVETSLLYRQWPARVKEDLAGLQEAVSRRDLTQLGRHAEQNALGMHATMLESWPPVMYWLPESVQAIHGVHALRESGVPVYFTMDAGPNVKLIFTAAHESAVRSAFPEVRIIAPFG
ncbi:MAG: diphosphomevalonate decarboxylase [Kiritimatiellae bacterium]|nr:diphosphomevalonate decarboxylase [Kiritimatiellia bacterium]